MVSANSPLIAPIKWLVGLAISDPDYAAWLAEYKAVDAVVGGEPWVALYEQSPDEDKVDGR